jgi:hypothetical protein
MYVFPIIILEFFSENSNLVKKFQRKKVYLLLKQSFVTFQSNRAQVKKKLFSLFYNFVKQKERKTGSGRVMEAFLTPNYLLLE